MKLRSSVSTATMMDEISTPISRNLSSSQPSDHNDSSDHHSDNDDNESSEEDKESHQRLQQRVRRVLTYKIIRSHTF